MIHVEVYCSKTSAEEDNTKNTCVETFSCDGRKNSQNSRTVSNGIKLKTHIDKYKCIVVVLFSIVLFYRHFFRNR